MYILSKLSAIIITTAMSLGVISPANLGSAVPTTPALYDSYLASGISKTDTSMTLSTGVLRNGASLSGFTCFTIDVNQPTVEYVCGTASGTSVTGLMRGVDVSDPNATSSSLAYAHRRFASVAISDYPTIQFLVRKVNGTDTLDSPMVYSSSVSTTTIAANGKNVASVDFVNGIAFGAIPAANETTAGFVEMATGQEAASSTSLGGTGARLVLGANLASSTYNSGSSKVVVVTGSNNKIDGNFVDVGTLDMGFGNGSDGDFTVSTSTTLTRDMFYDNLVINGTLIPAGYRIFAKTSISGSGSVIATGTPGTSAVTITGGAGGTTTVVGFFRNSAGGNGGTAPQNVDCQSGMAGTSTSAGVSFNALTSNAGTTGGGSAGACGGGIGFGGSGGTVTATATSTKYGVTYYQTVSFVHTSLSTSTLLIWSGAGGSGGGSGGLSCSSTCNGSSARAGGGGGGGSSGQIVFMASKSITGTFSVDVSGGNGGNGAAGTSDGDTTGGTGGGGGGGQGGTVIFLYNTKLYTGTRTTSGGTGGTGNTTAGNGSSGLTIDLPITSLLR